MMISESDRISISYFTNTRDDMEHHSWMFIEDLYQNIVPIYGSKQESVICKLEPADDEFEKKLTKILPSQRQRYNEQFNNIVLDTIQYMAQHLVNHGHLVLEFITQKDINERVLYKLDSVFGKELKIKKNKIIQVVHEDAAERLNITNPIEIPIEKCFVIEFPESLGGKDKYLKYLEEFKQLGQQSPMMNFMNNPLNGQVGYNITEHQRLHELELWKKSKTFNWHHRGSYEKLFTGYYHIYRHLLFRKSKIELRDFIIEKLKEIVSNLSEQFGEKRELKIEGLITIEKVNETIEQWNSGQLKPNSISAVL